MLRLFRSPTRGEIEPVRPPLNDKSLEHLSIFGYKCILHFNCQLNCNVVDAHKDVNAVRPPMSPTS